MNVTIGEKVILMMQTYIGSGNLPSHEYVWVDGSFVSDSAKPLKAVWFGLQSYPGRMWGCHLLLECGAFYRNVPPHAIGFTEESLQVPWAKQSAQVWDCYSWAFSCIEYTYLSGLECNIKIDKDNWVKGIYLFTVIPLFDGFSREPSQSKEFMFIKTNSGRLTIRPTNNLLFMENSFTEADPEICLTRQSTIYSCEF
ncbi:MAG: hypothetical protein ACRC78_02630 [Planktothrix sp.]